MKIEFVAAVDAAEILAVPVHEDRTLAGSGSDLDAKSGGVLTRAMSKGRFVGKPGQTLNIAAPSGVNADAILLVGAGAGRQGRRSGGRGLWRRRLCGGETVGR